MGSIAVDKFGCFGKLPVSREFLVERSTELTRSGFDSWVSEGMALARSPLGAAFKARATHFPSHQFIWTTRGRNGGGLVGRLVPGMDAAGRIHPFSIFAILEPDSIRSSSPAAPSRLSGVQGPIAAAISQARLCDDPAKVTDGIREIRAMLPDGHESDEYQGYVDRQASGDFWRALTGDALHPARYQILQSLYETVEYLRGRSAPDVRMGIRFPLPTQSGSLAIGFWIDLVARFFHAPIDGCSYFWTDGEVDGSEHRDNGAADSIRKAGYPNGGAQENGDPVAGASGVAESTDDSWRSQLLFFFSAPTTTQFLALIDPRSDVESISYLERPYGGPPEERMNVTLRALLDDPEAPLRAVLDWATRS